MANKIISKLISLQEEYDLEELSVSVCPKVYRYTMDDQFGLSLKKNGKYYCIFFKKPKQHIDEFHYLSNCIKTIISREFI